MTMRYLKDSFHEPVIACKDSALRPVCTALGADWIQIEKSLVNCETPGHTQQLSAGKQRRKIMIHLIWYIVVGLIAGVIAKSVMHVHMTIFWTIVLGIIGSIIGGAVTHMFSHPTTGRFHPAGLIFSTLGAILVLYICIKLNIRFPRVL
jgi:uncharacterized membrane protein YeaQ/YmgE (transglycosylase-associated protein family)